MVLTILIIIIIAFILVISFEDGWAYVILIPTFLLILLRIFALPLIAIAALVYLFS